MPSFAINKHHHLATLNQIKSPVWSYSITGGGAIAEGLAAIRQSIDIIIRTTKGTDPLRPEFGSDVYKYHDHPTSKAIPLVKMAILNAIRTWEPRVIITSIKHRQETAHVFFHIGYKLTDGSLIDALTVDIGNGGITTDAVPKRLILQGLFPPNPLLYQYQISGSLNDQSMLPAPPISGFPDRNALFNWVAENWLNYGQWYLTGDAVVGYINPEFTKGSLTIALIALKMFSGGIPALPIGYKYVVSITQEGVNHTSTSELYTPEDVRQWAQDHITDLGDWQTATNPGSFSEDWNEDWEIYTSVLLIYTALAHNLTIAVTTEEI